MEVLKIDEWLREMKRIKTEKNRMSIEELENEFAKAKFLQQEALKNGNYIKAADYFFLKKKIKEEIEELEHINKCDIYIEIETLVPLKYKVINK